MTAPVDPAAIDVGDWIRFYRNGALVIAEVRYEPRRNSWERHPKAITDVGEVAVDQVLEVRRKAFK